MLTRWQMHSFYSQHSSPQLLHTQYAVPLSKKKREKIASRSRFHSYDSWMRVAQSRAFTLNSESHSSTTLRSEPSIFLRDTPPFGCLVDKQRQRKVVGTVMGREKGKHRRRMKTAMSILFTRNLSLHITSRCLLKKITLKKYVVYNVLRQ